MTHDLGIVARIAVMYAGEMAARQVSGGGAKLDRMLPLPDL
jgi:hypothetical protein